MAVLKLSTEMQANDEEQNLPVKPDNSDGNEYSPDHETFLERMLENQAHELSVRVKEDETKRLQIDLQKQDMSYQHDLAKDSIAAHAEDRKQQRGLIASMAKLITLSIVGIVLLLIGFMLFAVIWNRDSLVSSMFSNITELAKYAFGAVIGYLFKASRSKSKPRPSDTDENETD